MPSRRSYSFQREFVVGLEELVLGPSALRVCAVPDNPVGAAYAQQRAVVGERLEVISPEIGLQVGRGRAAGAYLCLSLPPRNPRILQPLSHEGFLQLLSGALEAGVDAALFAREKYVFVKVSHIKHIKVRLPHLKTPPCNWY